MVKTEDHLREIVTIFFARKRIIIITTATFVLFASLVGLFWPPSYSATAEVLIKGKKVEKSPEALEDTQIRMFQLSEEDLTSEMQILISHDVLKETVTSMARAGVIYTEKDLEPTALTQEIISLQRRLSTDILPNSNVIEVTLSGKNPERTRLTLDHIINTYVSYRGRIYNPGAVEDFFAKQVNRFNADLAGKEGKLIELVNRTGAPNPNVEIEHNLSRKRDLEQQLGTLENQIVEKEGLVAHLEEVLDSPEISFFSFVNNMSINQLSEKLQQLIIEEGNLLRVYTENHPEVIAIRQQVQDVYDKLREELMAYVENERNLIDSDLERINIINQRLDEISLRNVELHTQLIEQQRIEREIELLKHSYATFAKRLEESRISGSAEAGSLFMVSVVSSPNTTGIPTFPNVRILLPIALFAGFITGLSLGFLKEFFDHTFKTPADSEKYAGLETIFTIPNWAE